MILNKEEWLTLQKETELRYTLISLRNKPTLGTLQSEKLCSWVLQWSLGSEHLNNSLTEIGMKIKLFVRLNTSQESALIANRESQEECNQRKHNAGAIEAQILHSISSPPGGKGI